MILSKDHTHIQINLSVHLWDKICDYLNRVSRPTRLLFTLTVDAKTRKRFFDFGKHALNVAHWVRGMSFILWQKHTEEYNGMPLLHFFLRYVKTSSPRLNYFCFVIDSR